MIKIGMLIADRYEILEMYPNSGWRRRLRQA